MDDKRIEITVRMQQRHAVQDAAGRGQGGDRLSDRRAFRSQESIVSSSLDGNVLSSNLNELKRLKLVEDGLESQVRLETLQYFGHYGYLVVSGGGPQTQREGFVREFQTVSVRHLVMDRLVSDLALSFVPLVLPRSVRCSFGPSNLKMACLRETI